MTGAGGNPFLVDVIVDHHAGTGGRDTLLWSLVTETAVWKYGEYSVSWSRIVIFSSVYRYEISGWKIEAGGQCQWCRLANY